MERQKNSTNENERQQALIRRFDRELLSRIGNAGMRNLGVGMLEVILVIWMMIPWQEMQGERILLGCGLLWAFYPGFLYINRYLQFTENGRIHQVYEKMRYLPVECRQVKRVRMQYLLRFCGKNFFLLLAVQSIFSLACYHELTWWNLLYVTVWGFLWPLGSNMWYVHRSIQIRNSLHQS